MSLNGIIKYISLRRQSSFYHFIRWAFKLMGLNAYSSGLITRMKIYKIISKRNTATFVKILAKICIRIKANSPKEAGPLRNKPEGQTFPFKLMFLMQLFRISMSDIVKKNNEREREGASISEGRYKESFSFRREGEANPGIRKADKFRISSFV